jgi:hypothetical protein
LNDQIDEVLPPLPGYLSESVDAIRVVGNFAAHPSKSEHTGEIADVEDGEAEWLLYTLKGLLDHSARDQRRKPLDVMRSTPQ